MTDDATCPVCGNPRPVRENGRRGYCNAICREEELRQKARLLAEADACERLIFGEGLPPRISPDSPLLGGDGGGS